MPINRLIQHEAFEPEFVTLLGEVFEEVLKVLGLVDRADPLTELVAKKVIELAQAGERDRSRLTSLTIKAFEERTF